MIEMERVTRIMVPLDGSPASEEALPVAIAVAQRTRARVVLVHVPENTDVVDGVPDDYPARLANESAPDPDVRVEVERLSGPVSDGLVLFAKTSQVDLIVMTSRGHGGMKRALCGSVADAVIRRSDRPVLLVRRAPANGMPSGADPGMAPFRRVLVPVDGTLTGEAVIPYLMAVTGTADVHVTLLRVHPALAFDGRPESGPVLRERSDVLVDSYLSTLAARVSETGVAVTWRAVVHGANADTIMKVANEEEADLIAMTTGGAGGADRLLFGSVADAVVRQAPQNVLIVRAPTR
jgi:nucleotide-binding universal stress UspA family protein